MKIVKYILTPDYRYDEPDYRSWDDIVLYNS